MFRITSRAGVCRALIGALAFASTTASAQQPDAADSLVRRALAVNPRIRAAALQLDASRARVGPAGAWSDPMVMAGIQNLPLSRDRIPSGTMFAGPEPMTMKMVGVSQTVPYPGKTLLRTRIARAETEIAEAQLAMVRRDVTREVLDSYYELTVARMVLAILERQQQVATSILPATEARYVAGSATQADLLKARTETTMLLQERNVATEQERSALARLTAIVNTDESLVIAADSFVIGRSQAIPELDHLLATATRMNPRLRERRAMIATRAAQADLAAKEHLPDFDVSLQIGQRNRLPDMISATVSVPLPVQRRVKQTSAALASRLDVTTAEAELRAEENSVRSDVTRAHAALQRQRTNIELLEQGILPQASATFASATATYQSGRGELLNVLDARRALFATEIMYARILVDYAKALNELAALVGEEVQR